MTVAPQTDWPPTVGRYLLYGEIASGGMATVHFGRLQGAAGFARSVAIKRLHPQYAKDPDFVGMFLDEARLAARIAHPNVVPTLDVVAQGDELLLVMEYVRGSSLSRLLRTLTQRNERMPPRIAAAILAGVLRGLHAAHEAKSEGGERLEIVHRDVSPQNVLVGTDGIARVLDFGVAKAAGRVQTTREGQLKGKLAYMAPEQITTGSVTRKTDVYAAAVVLWEMLTGRRLFRADNEAKLLSLVLDSEVLPPSQSVEGLPSGFDDVVMRGLDRDPGKRHETAREMAIEVEAVVGIAPPTEVGEWVELVAADELRERAGRIEEIERSVIGSSPGGVSTPWPASSPPSPSRRVDEPSTVQHGGRAGPSGRSRVLPPPPPLPRSLTLPAPKAPPQHARTHSQVSQVSQLSVSHTERPNESTRGPGRIIVLAALAFAAVGATVLALRPLHLSVVASIAPPNSVESLGNSSVIPLDPTAKPPAAALPLRSVASAAVPTPPPATPPPSSARPVQPLVASAPQAGAAPPPRSVFPPVPASGVVPSAEGPASTKQAVPKPPAVVYAPPPAPAPPPKDPSVAPRKPAPPPASDCNPPYTTDEKGRIHFKPSCV